jgi:2-methylisocitrate lyase-like PEP mutase family enzyme
MPYQEATAKLQDLIRRKGRVLTSMHPPSVALARVMETAGCEAGFVGTSGVVGSYTGMEDVGVADISECVMIAGWIARAVKFPVQIDGDTGHGGVMAVRRIVQDSIRAGLAGIRIDDQDIEGKRAIGRSGITVAPLDVVLARYKAAVDARNELDPNFVIMAQCYTGAAANGGFEEALERMHLYEDEAGVDWVQFTSPSSIEQIEKARAAVKGPFSIMEGYLKRGDLTDQELMDLGIYIRWNTPTHEVTQAAMYDYIKDFMARGTAATDDWRAANKDNPIANRSVRLGGEQTRLQEELEKRYFSEDLLSKYGSHDS